jgi:hypothetical protein
LSQPSDGFVLRWITEVLVYSVTNVVLSAVAFDTQRVPWREGVEGVNDSPQVRIKRVTGHTTGSTPSRVKSLTGLFEAERRPVPMADAWEYETLRPPRGTTKKEATDPKAALNRLGSDGWELVDTVDYVGGGTKYLLFKRPVDP